MEIHSSNCIVSNNRVNYFATGLNVVASVTNMDNVNISNNEIGNVDRGVLFWVRAGRKMNNVVIDSNIFTQIFPKSPIIDISVNVDSKISQLTIQNNLFTNVTKNPKLVAPPGIVVGRVSSCKIYNNKFLDLLGPGIKFGKIGADILTIDISRNNFVNTNRSRVINNNFVL